MKTSQLVINNKGQWSATKFANRYHGCTVSRFLVDIESTELPDIMLQISSKYITRTHERHAARRYASSCSEGSKD